MEFNMLAVNKSRHTLKGITSSAINLCASDELSYLTEDSSNYSYSSECVLLNFISCYLYLKEFWKNCMARLWLLHGLWAVQLEC